MNSEKPKFWNITEGKILSHTVHEHSNGLSMAVTKLHIMERELNKISQMTKEEIEVELAKNIEYLKSALDRMRKAMDYGYSEMKKLKGYD